MPLGRQRDGYRRTYRLKPDARFLLGVAEVHRFLTGETNGDLRLSFGEGRWTVKYAGRVAGTLPEIPSFRDGEALLAGWGAELLREHPIAAKGTVPKDELSAIPSGLDLFPSNAVEDSVARLDALWASTSAPELLPVALRGIVFLTAQTFDALGIAEQAPARGMALLGLCDALKGDNVGEERALLALLMGYGADAEREAHALPASSAVRAVATSDRVGVETIAAREPNDRVLQALALLRSGHEGSYETWKARWRRAPFARELSPASLSVAAPMLSKAFPSDQAFANLLLAVSLQDAGAAGAGKSLPAGDLANVEDLAVRVAGRGDLAPESAITPFEKALAERAAKLRGPFLDGALELALRRASFYSAVDTLNRNVADRFSSLEGARAFASRLSRVKEGFAPLLSRWYTDLANAKGGARGTWLEEDLVQQEGLGAAGVARTWDFYRRETNPNDRAVRRHARQLLGRLDTRPEFLHIAWEAAQQNLSDLRLMQTWLEAAVREGGWLQRDDALWYARFRGSAAAAAALRDLSGTPHLRREMLERLIEAKAIDARRADEIWTQLLREDPGSYATLQRYARWLIDEKRFEDARDLAHRWRREHAQPETLDSVVADTLIARAFRVEGKCNEAWAVAREAAASGQGDAVAEAARTLECLGRHEEALRTLEESLRRYPDSKFERVHLSRMLWMQRRYDDAARVLSSPGMDQEVWQGHVAPAFLQAFAGSSDDAASEAFPAIARAGIHAHRLQDFARGLDAKGHAELAYRVSSLATQGGLGQVQTRVFAYHMMKKARGPEAALAWLKGSIPAALQDDACVVYEGMGEPDLLWEMYPDPSKSKRADWIWLMRARVYASATESVSPARREELTRFYSSAPSGDAQVFLVGRFLLGLAGEAEVVALADADPSRRGNIAYAIAKRAIGEGRYGDASDWLEVAIENGGHDSAMLALTYWSSKELTLEELAKGEVRH